MKQPSIQTLIALASIAVHADEYLSKQGSPFDAEAIKGLLGQENVKALLAEMDGRALLPVRRDGVRYKEVCL